MPPAGYPAFLQYLQSGRVRKNEGPGRRGAAAVPSSVRAGPGRVKDKPVFKTDFRALPVSGIYLLSHFAPTAGFGLFSGCE